MTLDYLISYAEKLALASYHYYRAKPGEKADAYWLNGYDMCFIVRFEDNWWGINEHNGKVNFILRNDLITQIDKYNPIALSKTKVKSYPVIDYLFYLADDEITKWLTANNWQKNWGYNANFKDKVAVDYERWWQNTHPIYSPETEGNLFAVEGGWPLIWPDDDEPLLFDANNEFLFCTYYLAEPWFEVYRSKNNGTYFCFERIT